MLKKKICDFPRFDFLLHPSRNLHCVLVNVYVVGLINKSNHSDIIL